MYLQQNEGYEVQAINIKFPKIQLSKPWKFILVILIINYKYQISYVIMPILIEIASLMH
jgi:hypothetical protein